MATITAIVAAREPAGQDVFSAQASVASSVGLFGATLAALSADFEATRIESGLFVDSRVVLSCAINATRFYAGWAKLEDTASRPGPFFVAGSTIVSMDEWSIIAPLFRLYVERETALVIEASRGLGVEQVGRDSSTVASDILNEESLLAQKAYVEEAFSVGFPVGTLPLDPVGP